MGRCVSNKRTVIFITRVITLIFVILDRLDGVFFSTGLNVVGRFGAQLSEMVVQHVTMRKRADSELVVDLYNFSRVSEYSARHLLYV